MINLVNKRAFYAAGATVLCCLFFVVMNTAGVVVSDIGEKVWMSIAHENNSSVDIARDVEEFNKSLPRMMNSEVQLEKAEAGHMMITYRNNLVNFSASNHSNTFLSAMRSDLLTQTSKAACGSAFWQKTLDSGVTLSWTYYDKNGIYVSRIYVDAKDCKILN